MKKIESFLNTKFYIILIFTIGLLSWVNRTPTPDSKFLIFLFKDASSFNVYNIIGILLLVMLLCMVLILFKNSMYSMPILLSALISISNGNMDFNTLVNAKVLYALLFLIILSIVIHIIRFKPKLEFGKLSLGYLLIFISYIIPVFTFDTSLKNFAISIIGLFYLLIYLGYYNTSKTNIKYLMYILLFFNLAISFEMLTFIFKSIFYNQENISLLEKFKIAYNNTWSITYKGINYFNLGWANKNDIAIFITLSFPGIIYFIYQNPKKYYLYLLAFIPIVSLLLTKSRGGYIGFFIEFILLLVFIFKKVDKKYYSKIFIILGILLVLSIPFIFLATKHFINTLNRGNLNSFSSSRISIWKGGLELWKKQPVFGVGWTSIDIVKENIGFTFRLFIYHSTFFHTLICFGIFGLIALGIYFYEVYEIFKYKFSNYKFIILLGFIAINVHGLIDNTQHTPIYTILTTFIFIFMEQNNKELDLNVEI